MLREDYSSVFGSVPPTVCHGRQTYINPRALHLKPVWLKSDALTVAANGEQITTLTPPRDRGREGDAEIHLLTAESTDRFAVELYNDRLDRALMNNPVESSLVFGHGNLPHVLGSSLWIPAASSLKATVSDLSGNPNTVVMNGFGHQLLLPRTEEELARIQYKSFSHLFWLTFDAGSQVEVTGSGSRSELMTVPGDAHFYAWGLLVRSDGDLDLELVEGQRRSLMTSGDVMPIPTVAAQTLSVTGFPGSLVPACGLPLLYPLGHLMAPNTSLTARLTDTSASANNVSVALIGQLLYFDLAPHGIDDRNARAL